MKFLFETFPNNNYLAIHVDRRLANFQSKEYICLDEATMESGFVKDVFGIDGIETLLVSQYCLHVTKAQLFDWEDMKPLLIDVLKSYFDKVI